MDPFQQLIKVLGRLPGVGRRSAERIAVAAARDPQHIGRPLIDALTAVESTVCGCAHCGALTTRDVDPCRLCTDPGRDGSRICVVEDPGDIAVLERSRSYRGRYFALLGKISPQQEETVPQRRLAALTDRVRGEGVAEVILALNTDVEGDATAAYLQEALAGTGVAVSRLGLGIPVGSGIAWSDPVTLSRAIEGRQRMAGRET